MPLHFYSQTPDRGRFSFPTNSRLPFLLLLLALFIGSAAHAQLFRPVDSPDLNRRISSRDTDLREFSLLTLDEAEAARLITEQPTTLRVDLPNPSGGNLSLDLARFDLLGPNFQVIEMPANRVVTDTPEGVFYRGKVLNQAGSFAVLSIIDSEVMGLVSLPGQSGELNLVSLEDEDAYLLYDDVQIKDKFNDLDCTVLEPDDVRQPIDKSKSEGIVGKVDGCFGIFLDIGQEVYIEQGGTNGAVAFMQGAFAEVATLYANEAIDITISGTQVWTTREPFYKNLDQYRSYRAGNRVDGSVAHYVHRGGGGGVAYLDVLCNGSYGYGLSGIDNGYRAVPNFSWTVMVLAHELGHNFGSPHTHDCAWNGNNTPIDNCYSPSGGCAANGVIPQDGGTIMSYCHLTEVGINFTKGFGTQPGNRIRSRASNAGCSGFDCGTGGGGGGTGGGDDTALLPDGQYYMTARHSGRQLRIDRGSQADGANIIQFRPRDLRSQKWNLTHLGNNVYQIVNEHSGKAMDVSGISTEDGANVHQWSYVGGANQQWRLESVGDDYFHVIATHSDKCLNIEGASKSNGGNAVQWPCTTETNDDFRFVPVNGSLVTGTTDEMQVDLYPNPANGGVHLELRLGQDREAGQVTLSDAQGRTVEEWNFRAQAGTHELDFDVSNRAAGLYLIRIRAGEQTIARRLVVTE
ncbi:RICIN domain-containing protein [Lewinella sp. IMCC34191]|uniref:RICIN domain-containing protein n=1 Tax=Lewinella sp. IMCC34191 TaxID=2259172 RepID=UPI000E276C85|nr:RICIN domain-containing protein [Lewinella sp. IMCC34191]